MAGEPSPGTCWSRPGPAPASRSATWCRRCTTRSGSSSPRRRSRCSTSWSSATCRGWPRRSRAGRGSTRRTPCSRAAPTTPACTGSGEGVPDDQGVLVEVPEGTLGKKVLELRKWAEEEATDGGSGEKDAAPRHTDREWRQVSVSARECLGATKCPFGEECFAERAREKAQRSHLIITNHSLLAIDAIEGIPMIPDYDAVVIDEAPRAGGRVTQAATDELWAVRGGAGRPPIRSARPVRRRGPGRRPAGRRRRAAGGDGGSAAGPVRGRSPTISRTRSRWCATRLGRWPVRFPRPTRATSADAGLTQAKGNVQELFATADRMAANSDADVLWLTEGTDRLPPRLCVAPLQVWGPMREKLLADKTVVMTSATLMLGGDFTRCRHLGRAQARRAHRPARWSRRSPWRPSRRPSVPKPTAPTTPSRGSGSTSGARSTTASRRSSTSPGTFPRPAATGSGRPSSRRSPSWSMRPTAARSGCSPAGGRRRPRPSYVREKLPHLTTLAQGDAQLPELPGSSSTTRTPACSARSACGRASTSRVTPASW